MSLQRRWIISVKPVFLLSNLRKLGHLLRCVFSRRPLFTVLVLPIVYGDNMLVLK